jgi:hypothetical protein
MDWLTTERVTLALVVLGYLLAALRWLAPRTATTVDDRAVAAIDAAEAWAERWAPTFWGIVERAAKDGRLPSVQKAAKFAELVRLAYRAQHDHDMPQTAQGLATTIADHLSVTGKVEIPAVPPDPRNGPA